MLTAQSLLLRTKKSLLMRTRWIHSNFPLPDMLLINNHLSCLKKTKSLQEALITLLLKEWLHRRIANKENFQDMVPLIKRIKRASSQVANPLVRTWSRFLKRPPGQIHLTFKLYQVTQVLKAAKWLFHPRTRQSVVQQIILLVVLLNMAPLSSLLISILLQSKERPTQAQDSLKKNLKLALKEATNWLTVVMRLLYKLLKTSLTLLYYKNISKLKRSQLYHLVHHSKTCKTREIMNKCSPKTSPPKTSNFWPT